MDSVPRKFPFSTSFQFREDEKSGLEALFQRALFSVPYSAEARQALQRTRARLGGKGDKAGEASPAPASKEGASPRPASGRELLGPATAADEAPRYVLLYRGASGIGKTRIFRQFRESARQKDIPVYEIYHHDVEGIPFKPFVHAIRQILRDHDRGAALQEKYRYGLEAILPELYEAKDGTEPAAAGARGGKAEPGAGAERPAGTIPPRGEWLAPGAARADLSPERIRLFDAITQLLLEVTAQSPLIILVHDLHSSDRPTIELLGYIGRNLQLRNSGAAPAASAAFIPEAGPGPELDGFESGEWRALGRGSPRPVEFPGPDVPRSAGALEGTEDRGRRGGELPPAEAAGEASRAPPRAVAREGGTVGGGRRVKGSRLMVLANYQGFADPNHYLEQALRSLGEESFTYHGELRVLTREEADAFIQRSIAGIEVDGQPLVVAPDAIDAIYEASEGFPSFMHELFRAMYLREGSFADSDPRLWTGEAIRAAVRSAALPAAAGATSAANLVPEEERSVPGPRHAILGLRLAEASRDEVRVLQAIAAARRPVTPALVARALGGGEDSFPGGGRSPEADVLAALSSLEERGIIERPFTSPAEPGAGPVESGSEGEGYFFRLWDYTLVVEATIDEELQKVLAERIGEEVRSRLEAEGDETAYEVYFHLRRGLNPRSSIPYGLLAASRFQRSFALEKARRVYRSLSELIPEDPAADAGGTGPGGASLLVDILEQAASLSLILKDTPATEDLLRRAQTVAASLPAERRVDLVLLEAEAARRKDPGKALKILARGARLLSDENTRLGIRVQLATARARLEYQDMKRAINFSLKGLSIGQKVGNVPELGELYRVMANAFYRKGDYAHAVDNYERALEAFEGLDLKQAVGVLDELGRVYLERGNHFRAARYLYKSLEIRRAQHDIAGLSRSYDELGRVYLRSGDYLKTIENLGRSLALKERIGDFEGLNPTLVILGDLFFRLGRYEQSLAYFKREVENSQKTGDTRGLVESFVQLGRVYFELGDLKQAESLAKQVSILASEFKLRSQDGDGMLLSGNLKALARDWADAEKLLKQAGEVHAKLGHRRREVSAYLDLAELKLARDLHDEALKIASKGQIIAEETKALDLQVRALTIKGNIHRFLKGGNIAKTRECLHKALELSQGLSDATTLFSLYYSLAKVCHSEREFAEAANYYTKAELILKQIGDALSEDRAGRFFEDRRRKVFAEDLARFRKEAMGRTSGAAVDLKETSTPAVALMDRPVGAADYKDLSGRILRLHAELNQLRFHDRLLVEALEIAGADRGVVLRVQSRQYFPVALQGFGRNAYQDPEFSSAIAMAQEAIRKGRSAMLPGAEDRKDARTADLKLEAGELGHRAVLIVPFMNEERIFGGVYLDRPLAVGQFLPRSQVLLEAFAQHAAVALNNRREFETAIREPLTGFYTPSFFVDRLREAYRWYNLHGKAFTVLGFHLPMLEEGAGAGREPPPVDLAKELAEVLPQRAVTCWGSPILYVLLQEDETQLAEEVAEKARERLRAAFAEEIALDVLPVHDRYQHGSEIYFEMRRRLLPEGLDRKVLSELRSLLENEVSLRDAKKILERHKIESTLKKTGGNITHAARELGIHRPQLSNLLKKYELRREVYEANEEAAEAEEGEIAETGQSNGQERPDKDANGTEAEE